jgi:hypothetical protein
MVVPSKCICKYISKAVIVGFSLVTIMLAYSLCSPVFLDPLDYRSGKGNYYGWWPYHKFL